MGGGGDQDCLDSWVPLEQWVEGTRCLRSLGMGEGVRVSQD